MHLPDDPFNSSHPFWDDLRHWMGSDANRGAYPALFEGLCELFEQGPGTRPSSPTPSVGPPPSPAASTTSTLVPLEASQPPNLSNSSSPASVLGKRSTRSNSVTSSKLTLSRKSKKGATQCLPASLLRASLASDDSPPSPPGPGGGANVANLGPKKNCNRKGNKAKAKKKKVIRTVVQQQPSAGNVSNNSVEEDQDDLGGEGGGGSGGGTEEHGPNFEREPKILNMDGQDSISGFLAHLASSGPIVPNTGGNSGVAETIKSINENRNQSNVHQVYEVLSLIQLALYYDSDCQNARMDEKNTLSKVGKAQEMDRTYDCIQTNTWTLPLRADIWNQPQSPISPTYQCLIRVDPLVEITSLRRVKYMYSPTFLGTFQLSPLVPLWELPGASRSCRRSERSTRSFHKSLGLPFIFGISTPGYLELPDQPGSSSYSQLDEFGGSTHLEAPSRFIRSLELPSKVWKLLHGSFQLFTSYSGTSHQDHKGSGRSRLRELELCMPKLDVVVANLNVSTNLNCVINVIISP
ncbi:hypothetical protein BDN72DRAFT_906315 [Pluteus cervinus]|uniref:Uncharacterized protein n=1 Tax=Pluteus cervinus TaxID=181527 RepID=A0ACD2ZZT0_9AGAR|nr:hypothetical protein BDN72DRAFT_906315 [Pluteus cervinus]